MRALHVAAAAFDPVSIAIDAADPVPTAIGVAALALGVAFLARGASGTVDAVRLLRTTATSPAGLDGAERQIRVRGRVAAVDDETLPAPFGGDPCCCVEYDVSELRSQGKGQSWVTIDGGEAGVPFRVDDGGTGVRVDPAAAAFSLAVDEKVKLDAGEEPPERVRGFIDAVDEVDDTETGYEVGPLTIGDDPRRRYVQRTLRPGDEVTVVGDSEAFPDAPVGEVKSRIADGSPFVVSDASARRTALRMVGGSAVPILLGAVAFGVAALLLSPIVTALV
ncbi:GIDE domain-containing protein [Halorubrum distributum]|uniref:GIDE domain-containing protein n=1 Tax=Halorubrum distributum TaxID=29283 RepID=UPI0029559809|nr:GIDE domain-containing protein [Halorubrum distributum]MDV7349777.1 GIDE domain-containing protein [Halorubrum distributum]